MAKSSFTRSEMILLLVLATMQFNHVVDFMILMPLGQIIMDSFKISPAQFSYLVASYTLCAGISGFAASFFTDFFDRKKLLIFFFMGFSVGTICCGLANSYVVLLLARSLTGMFGGVLGSLTLSIVSDCVPYSKRGSAMGIISTSFSMASVLGVPFGLYLSNLFGWHAGFRFLGTLSLFIFVLLFKVVPSQAQYVQKRSAKRDLLAPLKHVWNSSSQLWALLFAGSIVLGQFMVIPFLSPSLVANVGLTNEQLPLVYLVGGALTLITGPIVGRMADRYGKQKVFMFGIISAIFPILIITHLHRTPVWITLAIVGVFFICVNARWVPALAMISGSATPQNRGSFMSFVGCVQQLMAAAGAMVAGWIVLKDESGHLQRYGWTGVIAVAMSVIAIWVSYRVRVLEVDPSIPQPTPAPSAEPQAPA